MWHVTVMARSTVSRPTTVTMLHQCAPSINPASALTAACGGREESIDGRVSGDVSRDWGDAFARLGPTFSGGRAPPAQVRLDVNDARRFRGRLRSGRIGSLRYLRAWVSEGSIEISNLPMGRGRHELLLMASGMGVVETAATSMKSGAGDFMLFSGVDRLRLSFPQPAEYIVLSDPLDGSDAVSQFGEDLWAHRCARSDGTTVLSHGLQYACADRAWGSDEEVDSLSVVLRSLSKSLLHNAPRTTRSTLDRDLIEWHIQQSLEDPSLSVVKLADRCGCSTRTLHRVFRREGDDSIERYIQRRRVEACAALLRDPAVAAQASLTALAMRFGFSSSAHFSTVFRCRFGMPPSAYRQAFAAPSNAAPHSPSSGRPQGSLPGTGVPLMPALSMAARSL